jgi:hypothetical protein
MKRSRRRFLGLLAAGSAAAAATPAAALARVVTPRKKAAGPAPGAASAQPAGQSTGPGVSSALAEEIRKQKATIEQALKAVRDYPLPPGSEPACFFAPFGPRKKADAP